MSTIPDEPTSSTPGGALSIVACAAALTFNWSGCAGDGADSSTDADTGIDADTDADADADADTDTAVIEDPDPACPPGFVPAMAPCGEDRACCAPTAECADA